MIRLAIAMTMALAGAAALALADGGAVTVRTAKGAIVQVPTERYVAGVLAGESSVFRSDAALAAMAVAARTYAIRMRGRHAADGYDFCSSTHCQRLDMDSVTARLTAAATKTAGELLWFEGKPAFTPFSLACGGRSESAAAVWPDMAAPYLTAHDDPYCRRAGNPDWQWAGEPRRILEALARAGLKAPRTLEGARVEERTASGRASVIVLSGDGLAVRISASSLRFAIGRDVGWNTLRSDWFDVRSIGGRLVFQGKGSGHGVGLCQRGADQMGVEGRSYREILAFYYAGASVGVSARGIEWRRICGSAACLRSVDPERDREALAILERQLRAAAERTGWTVPTGVELTVYPDVETFRNATGEPGWVAAHTVGHRIHLQPVGTLRGRNALESTICHEALHLFVEAHAAADLPLWFREGVILWLASRPAGEGPLRIPSDADLRRTDDPERARRAYEEAGRAVASLAARYTERSVLEWVKSGLPADVRKAIASGAATNRQ